MTTRTHGQQPDDEATAQRRTQDALQVRDERHAQKMEAIGRLAGAVAHDFNNLLTAVIGYSAALLAEMDDSDSHRADVLEIARAGEAGATLTRQLLVLSGRKDLQPQPIRLNEVVADVVATLAPIAGEPIEIMVRTGSDPGLANADPSAIREVITHLVDNAREAMPRGGVLTIETANAEIDETSVRADAGQGRSVRLTVTDTGCGMTREVQERLFEPFFTTKGRATRSGCGLATVYGIVRRSGGFVSVTSEAGRGSAFSVFLPRSPRP